MIVGVVDTHAYIWYLTEDKRLSETAKAFIDNATNDGDSIALSSISLVESLYLSEKQRITADAFRQLVEEVHDPESVFIEYSVNNVVVEAMQRVPWKDVPDMPDRVIAATALVVDAPLVTLDQQLQESTIKTIW